MRIYLLVCLTIAFYISNLNAMEIPGIKKQKEYLYDLAVVAIFQNEAPYLKEWIEFHKLVGVQHFYLYNNLSTDNYLEVLEPYISNEEAEIIEWPPDFSSCSEWNAIQCESYMHAIKLTRKKVKWVAFIDIDEFLYPVHVNDLKEFLKDYESCCGLRVNWQCFGTSNIKRIPQNELLIANLLIKAPRYYEKHQFAKSIVRPIKVSACLSAYAFDYKGFFTAVDADREPQRGTLQPVLVDKIRINHYWTRDEEYFENVKLKRLARFGEPEENSRQLAKDDNVVFDTTILRFIPEMKKRMGFE